MQSTTQRYRRQEGIPLTWKQLTLKQRLAVKDVAELLLDALNSVDENNRSDDNLDTNRRSQIAFIDGDRGMGKSSVLLTINKLIQGKDTDCKNIAVDTDQYGQPVDYNTVEQLRNNRNRFVWLETLDMETLPRHSNVLAAILARLNAEFSLHRGKNGSRMTSVFDEPNSFEKTITELNNLQSTAVQAWAGVHPQRAVRIGHSSYTAEVRESELAGLKLNSRLTKTLESLSELKSRMSSFVKNPIFIIPVDDFDLAPPRCLELLRTIRMVTTPRLFFLVAGNTRIAEDVLRLQSEGELAALAGEHMTRIEASIIRERSIEIASNNLRKLIPPQQRARLTVVPVDEALNFRLKKKESFEQILEKIKFNINNIPFDQDLPDEEIPRISLKEFLLLGDNVKYTGKAWLAGTPRQILDRAATFSLFSGIQDYDWGANLLRAICSELKREVREDTRLIYDQRERLAEALDTTEEVRFYFEQVFRLNLTVKDSRDFSDKSDSFTLRLRFPERVRFTFRALNRSETSKSNSNQEWQSTSDRPQHEPEAIVPRNISAGFTFLYDLAISLWGGYIPYPGFFREIKPDFSLVEVMWHGVPLVENIAWFSPGWWTLKEHERFYAHWEQHALPCRSEDEYAAGWLAAQLEVLMNEPFNSSNRADNQGLINYSWLGSNIRKLAAEKPKRRARKDLRENALIAILLLLAPESTTSKIFTSKLLNKTGNVFSSKLDYNIILRVSEWRAVTFVTIKSQTKKVHLKVKNHGYHNIMTVRLLSAINGELAITLISNELLAQHIKNLKGREIALKDSTFKVLANIVDRKERLKKILEIYEAETDSIFLDEVKNLIEAGKEALKQPFLKHKINTICNKELMPTAEQIKRFQNKNIRRPTQP